MNKYERYEINSYSKIKLDERSVNGQIGNHPYYDNFNENVVYNSVYNMVKWFESISHKDAPVKKIGFIYAWNKYNEGSWLTKSKLNDLNLIRGV